MSAPLQKRPKCCITASYVTGQFRTHAPQQTTSLFDHFVGACRTVTQESLPRGGLSEIGRCWCFRSGCDRVSVLPPPAPSKQTHRAEASGEERESGWEWRQRYSAAPNRLAQDRG